MSTTKRNKPSVWYWVISVVALLWNLAGVSAYLGQAYMKDEMMASYSDVQKELMNNLPPWITGAFAIAVFAAALGCFALLMRKKWAHPLFVISLLAVLARTVHFFFMTNGTDIFSFGEGTVMPIVTVIISAFLIIFTKVSIDKGWI
jgi:hypothetical protein